MKQLLLATLLAMIVSPAIASEKAVSISAKIGVHNKEEGKLYKNRIAIFDFFYLRDKHHADKPYCSVSTTILLDMNCEDESTPIAMGSRHVDTDDEYNGLSCRISELDKNRVELTVTNDENRSGIDTHKIIVGKSSSKPYAYYAKLEGYSGVWMKKGSYNEKIYNGEYVPITTNTQGLLGATDKLFTVNCPIKIPALLVK
jgi:hypothetical protein